jgi:hypothetical protein
MSGAKEATQPKNKPKKPDALDSLRYLVKATVFCKCGAIMWRENLGCMVGYMYHCDKCGASKP